MAGTVQQMLSADVKKDKGNGVIYLFNGLSEFNEIKFIEEFVIHLKINDCNDKKNV